MSVPARDVPTFTDGGPQTGRDVSRYVRVEMREIEARRDGSPRHRGPRAGVGASPRSQRRDPRRRAAHDARQRRRPVRRARRAPRRLGRVDQPLGAHRATRRTSDRSGSTRACLRQGRASVVTAVEIRDEGARRRARRRRRADLGDPRARERSAAVDAAARARARASPLEAPVPPIPEWLGARAIDGDTVEMPLARHAAQPVGHPARRRGRVAHRPRRRTRHRRRHRPMSCCTSSRRTASGRCAPPRARSAPAPTAPCCASRCATRAPTASPRSRSSRRRRVR